MFQLIIRLLDILYFTSVLAGAHLSLIPSPTYVSIASATFGFRLQHFFVSLFLTYTLLTLILLCVKGFRSWECKGGCIVDLVEAWGSFVKRESF